jgi:hypothetical protein
LALGVENSQRGDPDRQSHGADHVGDDAASEGRPTLSVEEARTAIARSALSGRSIGKPITARSHKCLRTNLGRSRARANRTT